MIFFTSDLHFGHNAVIRYCDRPFDSVDKMNEQLVTRWNSRVTDSDTVYVLGDLSFVKFTSTVPLMKEMRGRKILIQGNHDHFSVNQYRELGFDYVAQHVQIRFAGTRIWLSHYPYKPIAADLKAVEAQQYDVRYLERRLDDQGGWLLHGHVHQYWKQRRRMINVGVDVWGYYPVSASQIEALMAKGPYSEPEETTGPGEELARV